jgi:hypothetical protein
LKQPFFDQILNRFERIRSRWAKRRRYAYGLAFFVSFFSKLYI